MPKSHRVRGRKQPHLTLDQKAKIVTYATEHHKLTNVDITNWASKTFNTSIHPSSIGRILQRQNEYTDLTPQERKYKSKHRRDVKNKALETILRDWIILMGQRKARLTTAMIKGKAEQFAQFLGCGVEFKFSNGWYSSFAKRNGFKKVTIHGESGDAQMQGIEDRITELQVKIASYALKDVYNMDETAYFYNLAPDKTIAQQQIEGAKKDKTRMTIAVTCNATGTDLFELLILGHAVKPRCFKKKSGKDLGFFYMSNKKAWMTGDFFQQYLHRLNAHVGRKVLLLIDNAPSHIWQYSDDLNLEIVALPSNTTSKLQPLDAGIIAAFKCQMRKQQLAYALDILDHEENPNPYKVDQLTAMRWARIAWTNMKSTVIQNCWRHTGLLSPIQTEREREAITETIATANIVVQVDAELREDYNRFVARANIKEAIAIENFLNPVEEEKILMNMEMLDIEEYLLQTADVHDNVESDSEGEAEAEKPLYSELSPKEQVTALAMAIAVCEGRDSEKAERLVQGLREVQRKIRWEQEKAEQDRLIQRRITHYF